MIWNLGSFLSNDENSQYEDIIHNTYWYFFDIQKEEIIEERRLDEREKEYQQKITNLIPINNNTFIECELERIYIRTY